MGLIAPVILLDSSVLIDHLNGHPDAVEYLRSNHHICAISPITFVEVLTGYDEDDFDDVMKLLESFPRVELTPDVLRTAAQYRRMYRLCLPDALQAALAFNHHLTLATRDMKDLSPKRFPFIRVPY
jgi:predicted nucleic acid-binding protein